MTSHASPLSCPATGLRLRTGLRAGKPLGDVVLDITRTTGLERLAQLYTQVTGLDCGCHARQDWLNQQVPDFNRQNS